MIKYNPETLTVEHIKRAGYKTAEEWFSRFGQDFLDCFNIYQYIQTDNHNLSDDPAETLAELKEQLPGINLDNTYYAISTYQPTYSAPDTEYVNYSDSYETFLWIVAVDTVNHTVQVNVYPQDCEELSADDSDRLAHALLRLATAPFIKDTFRRE